MTSLVGTSPPETTESGRPAGRGSTERGLRIPAPVLVLLLAVCGWAFLAALGGTAWAEESNSTKAVSTTSGPSPDESLTASGGSPEIDAEPSGNGATAGSDHTADASSEA